MPLLDAEALRRQLEELEQDARELDAIQDGDPETTWDILTKWQREYYNSNLKIDPEDIRK